MIFLLNVYFDNHEKVENKKNAYTRARGDDKHGIILFPFRYCLVATWYWALKLEFQNR